MAAIFLATAFLRECWWHQPIESTYPQLVRAGPAHRINIHQHGEKSARLPDTKMGKIFFIDKIDKILRNLFLSNVSPRLCAMAEDVAFINCSFFCFKIHISHFHKICNRVKKNVHGTVCLTGIE